MSTFGLWDDLEGRYGGDSSSSVQPTQVAYSQPPASALATLNSPTTTSGGGSSSPNYLGLAGQGASAGNSLLGGNSALGTLGSGLGIYNALASGTPVGDARAAVGAGQLANKLGAFGSDSSAASSTLGGAGGALGLYSGLQQGGVGGDTQAALGAAQTAAPIASFAGSSLAPALAAATPIALAVAPALIGMSTPAVQLGQKYWTNYANTLQNAISSGDPGQVAAHALGLLSMPQSQVPTNIQNMLYQTGMVPASGWGLGTNDATNAAGAAISANTANKGPTGRPTGHMAKGGKVKDKNVRSKLRELYEGSFANRPRHYDGGGYVGIYDGSPNYITSQYAQPSPPDLSGLVAPNNSQQALQEYLNNNTPSGVNESANPVPTGLQEGSNPAMQNPNIPGLSTATGSVLGSGGALSGLGSALGVSSMGQLVQQYGALAPLIAAALGGNKAASPPATPAGYGAIPSIATPTNTRSYTQPNIANWYTYGQGPEQSFFSNNQLPTIPGVSPASITPAGATSGTGATPVAGTSPGTMTTQPLLQGGMHTMAQGGAFDSSQGDSYVPDPGDGDGTSDGIDAKLSGGEYVMDAGTVSTLGNGSNEAGARALDQLRARVRKHAGKQLVKGKQFMKAKPPEAYLRGGKE
jgi:hypothetical protein